jgi:CheY-like chemotaxis protein
MFEAAAMPQSRSSRPAPVYSPLENGTGLGSPKSTRILIVEDDYFVATDLEHRLREAGVEVVGVAGTAEEAIEIAAAKLPTLAIMDIRLAGQRDGIDAAIELLSRYAIPSIFATAHNDTYTRQRAQKAYPLGWVTKPYSANDVLTILREVLGTRR